MALPTRLAPNEGIVILDVPPSVWAQMNVQQQVLFMTHNLIDFASTPAFHVFEGLRIQVRATGIIMPVSVPLCIGKQPGGLRTGAN